jgi:hypothetical protein
MAKKKQKFKFSLAKINGMELGDALALAEKADATVQDGEYGVTISFEGETMDFVPTQLLSEQQTLSVLIKKEAINPPLAK